MKKIKVLVFDPKKGKIIYKEIEDCLQSYYSEIGCSIIEKITIDDVTDFSFDVIMDEEGKLKEEVIPSYDYSEFDFFVGKLIFTRANEEGNWIGLTEEEMQAIINNHSFNPYLHTNFNIYFIMQRKRAEKNQEIS